MTSKELALKVLEVMDSHEKSYISGGITGGHYSKTILHCFTEIFSNQTDEYFPYYFAIQLAWNDMESWARSQIAKP